MAFFDRFKKPKPTAAPSSVDARMRALTDPRAPVGPDELRPGVLLEVQLEQADLLVARRDSEVAAANRIIAAEILAGEHKDLPEPIVGWFLAHNQSALSPTQYGWTWYPLHETGGMQLVHTAALVLDPNPRIGSLVWGSRAAIDRWPLSEIAVETSDDEVLARWKSPGAFADVTCDLVQSEGEGRAIFSLDLSVGRQLGSDSLAREFEMVTHSAVQFMSGVDPSTIDDSQPPRWHITAAPGSETTLVRAAVRSLYAIGLRLPGGLQAAMPRPLASASGQVADSDVVSGVDGLAAQVPSAAPRPATHSFSDYQPLIDDGHELPLDDPAFQRKLRSEERLQAMGVPTLAWLPMLVGEDEAQVRSQEEVISRAVCLMAVGIKAEVVRDGDWLSFAPVLDEVIDGYGVRAALSPAELLFLDDPTPSAQTNTQFGWRYEGLSTLLWALGFTDELSWPVDICNVAGDCAMVKELGPEGLATQANLRSAAEILEEADHIYRLHWAVRQARHNQTFPAPAVEPGIVIERHHTLNWLIGTDGWDAVDTST